MQEKLRDTGSIPGSERSPGGGHGNPLQDPCLENPHGQRSLVGYSPQGHTKSDTNETTWPAETHPCCEVSVIVHSTKSFMTATFNTDLSRSALTSVSSQKGREKTVEKAYLFLIPKTSHTLLLPTFH